MSVTGYPLGGRGPTRTRNRGFVVVLTDGTLVELTAHQVQFTGGWLAFYRDGTRGMVLLRAYPAHEVKRVDGVPANETSTEDNSGHDMADDIDRDGD